jgi:hypothetical protein
MFEAKDLLQIFIYLYNKKRLEIEINFSPLLSILKKEGIDACRRDSQRSCSFVYVVLSKDSREN